MQAIQTQKAQLQTSVNTDGVLTLRSSGDWTLDNLDEVAVSLKSIADESRAVSAQWAFSDVGRVDSAGMMLFIHYVDVLGAKGCKLDITGMSAEHEKLYQLMRRHVSEHIEEGSRLSLRIPNLLAYIGRGTVELFEDIIRFLAFIGENFTVVLSSLRHPASVRYGAIARNIEDAGMRAIPIVAVTSFLIGVVVAYQGGVQLEKFGANIFIVDMIGISISRELAPLITAIVVAGRTGSSYTAQIGVMKITEEIDAMRTMGFEPHRFLVVPRILALMITLPLMIFLADVIGILGGMVIANLHMHLSYTEFLHRLQGTLDVKQVWIGVIKGPVFAWLIATVGCFYGFRVSGNTESIGRYTTISVVNAIFLVIACDAIFSVLLTSLGI